MLPPVILRALAFNGNFGVTMFFVISGFLITSNSLMRWNDLKAIDVPAFYLYRFARIMPSLILVLAIIVTLGSFDAPFFNNTDDHHQLPASYFFISVASVLGFWHNVLMQSSGYVNYCIDIYWSLSVEEVFYLVLPLACLLLRRTALIVAVCIVAIAIGPIYRSQHTDNEILFMYGYFACFDAIAFGCITALLARYAVFPEKFNRAIRLFAGGAICVVYMRGINGHEIFGFSFIALASAAFLLGSANDGRMGWTTGRVSSGVRWLGRHSYEIYLFHVVVLGLMRNVLNKEQLSYEARLPWFFLFLSLSVLVAWLVARYVSEPANVAIRQRYVQSRRQS